MQRYGVVKTFVVSVLLFTLSSFLCGIAWSLPTLIFFRVLQGATSGPMIPGSQALLIYMFPPERKGTALVIWSMTTLVAPICGPIMGGYIADNWSWPWIFLINVPVGLFVSAVCWRNLASMETPTRSLPIDSVGLGLLVVWVGSLQIMLDKGKDLDWFESTPIVVLTLVAVVSFIAWLIWELTEEHPIVDLTLFKSRNFVVGVLAFSLGFAIMFGNLVLLPLWLQTQFGYTATWAGLAAAPAGVVSVLLSPLVGRAIGKIDARWLASSSLLAFAISYYMRAQLTMQASFFDVVMPMLVQGIGMSAFFVAMLTIMLEGLPPERIPVASGLSNFLRIIAASFATSITTTFWDRHEALHQTHLAEASSAFSPALQNSITNLQGLGVGQGESIGMLTRELIRQAYLLSSLDYFWISTWLCSALVVMVWFTRRARGGAPVAAAE
jgi:DHA2 family multidrug resistance protein